MAYASEMTSAVGWSWSLKAFLFCRRPGWDWRQGGVRHGEQQHLPGVHSSLSPSYRYLARPTRGPQGGGKTISCLSVCLWRWCQNGCWSQVGESARSQQWPDEAHLKVRMWIWHVAEALDSREPCGLKGGRLPDCFGLLDDQWILCQTCHRRLNRSLGCRGGTLSVRRWQRAWVRRPDRPARFHCKINICCHSNWQGGCVFVGSDGGMRQQESCRWLEFLRLELREQRFR